MFLGAKIISSRKSERCMTAVKIGLIKFLTQREVPRFINVRNGWVSFISKKCAAFSSAVHLFKLKLCTQHIANMVTRRQPSSSAECQI